MAQLKRDFDEEIQAIGKQWPKVNNSTKSKLSSMKSDFANTGNGMEVLKRTENYRNELKGDYDRHADLAARGVTVTTDLGTQVKSSKNRVTRMKKHGKLAVFFFAILGIVIGAAIGSKVPGFGKIATIAVGAVIGGIGCLIVGLSLYCICKCRLVEEQDEWEEYQQSNKGNIEMIGTIDDKKSDLDEILKQMNDLEEGNMKSGRTVLAGQMSKYLCD